MAGIVYLVGTGPGDPELLTIKAYRLLRQADVVLYDRLMHPDILAWARTDAIRESVGKAPGGYGVNQEEIHRRMIAYARKGRMVVRLKGGDPFVLGRGGEEILTLAGAGVAVDVVPGVTSALAVPALAGIPATHRGVTTSVWIASAHDPELVEWHYLARTNATVVLLMGMATLSESVRRLMGHGRDGNTPAAVVANGSWPDQTVVRAPLISLAQQVRETPLRNPAVIVIGNVTEVLQGFRRSVTPDPPPRGALEMTLAEC